MEIETPDSGGSSITPAQALRNTLSAFRFDEETTPSLRRSPRNHIRAGVKAEETESELPVVITGSSRKRSVSNVAVDSDAKKAKSQRRSKISAARPAIAPPEKYAHLNSLNDYLGQEPDMLDVLFCGINPGQRSATVGHHFAHPTNHFWKCLYGANLTDRLVNASEDYTLPDTYHLGLTNLVERPSAQAAELAGSEFTAGVPALLRKIVRKRPRIVCFVGKAIWESFIKAVAPPEASIGEVIASEAECIEQICVTGTSSTSEPAASSPTATRVKKKSVVRESSARGKLKAKSPPFQFGLQPYKVVHSDPNAVVHETLFCVVVSTSGLVAGYQLPEKIQQFSSVKRCLDDLQCGNLGTSAMHIIPTPQNLVAPQ
ncbi:DNA glycosylase [Trametes coccinea BRFM310]|uniref:DNA glycosylase n=1 Tax=Trametes coccinea (strain BRFM310) TaxID=1353009 RepID=A0A1Y2IRM4_TRAC3|nr:DNA glycosylase [Trametes coccinea BRFM310]